MGSRRLDLMDSPLHHFLKRCDVRPAQSRSPLAAESSRFYAARTAKNPGFRTKSAGGPGLDFETWVALVVETEPRRFQKDC